MTRLILTAILLSTVLSPSFGQDPKQFVGKWTATSKAVGFDHSLVIAYDEDRWSLVSNYSKDKEVAGTAQGLNFEFKDGKLSYSQKYVKKPVNAWKDSDTLVTLSFKGEQLDMVVSATGKLIRTYNRVEATEPPKQVAKEVPQPVPTPPAPPAPKTELDPQGQKLLGTLAARVDRMLTVIAVNYEQGAWSVSGLFKESGRDVGGFDGADFIYEKGVLTFTQKFFRKPRPDWKDDEKFTLRLAGNQVVGIPDRPGAVLRTFERIDAAPATPASGLKKDDPRRLVGTYRGTAADGTPGFLVIAESGGNFTYHATWYNSAGKIVGTTVGGDVRAVDGSLVLVQRHLRKPHASWHDNSTIKLELVENTLTQTRQEGAKWVRSASFTRAPR